MLKLDATPKLNPKLTQVKYKDNYLIQKINKEEFHYFKVKIH